MFREGVKYNPVDAGIFVEGSKVVGQNSVRVAGQVIIGKLSRIEYMYFVPNIDATKQCQGGGTSNQW